MQRTAERAIVIGSGIGGMSMAIILARLGYQVTVLEKNTQPGGLISSYRRQGVSCSIGLHYLGALAPGQVLRRCFDYLGISDKLRLQRMGVEGPVDRYLFTNPSLAIRQFDQPSGFSAYEQQLRTTFPAEDRQISELMTILASSARLIDGLDFLYADQPMAHWLTAAEPLGTMLDRLHCSPGLRAVFGLPAVLIGVPPAVCPLLYHGMTLASYLLSAWRLTTGSRSLADVCVERLEALGGTLRTQARVRAINTASGAVCGVTLADNEQIPAPLVINTSHPAALLRMLDPQQMKASLRHRIQGLTNTGGMVTVQALLPAERHPTLAHNIFVTNTTASGDARDLLYIQLRPCEQKQNNLLTLITSGHQHLWQNWHNTVSGQRGAAYRAAKATLAEQLIDQAARVLGPLPEWQLLDVATPLSIRDWVDSPDGAAYGVLRSSEQLMAAALLNRAQIPGLFQAGQSVLAPGILGTILGSLATTQWIIGNERFRQEVRI